MTESGVNNNINKIVSGESEIRQRLLGIFDKIISKNEECLKKAREHGMEKIMSRILAVKKRMERLRGEMNVPYENAEFKLEKISDSDEAEIKVIDQSLEKSMLQCSGIIDNLSCMETDMHITEKFAKIDDCLRDVEDKIHKKMSIFRKMRVYG